MQSLPNEPPEGGDDPPKWPDRDHDRDREQEAEEDDEELDLRSCIVLLIAAAVPPFEEAAVHYGILVFAKLVTTLLQRRVVCAGGGVGEVVPIVWQAGLHQEGPLLQPKVQPLVWTTRGPPTSCSEEEKQRCAASNVKFSALLCEGMFACVLAMPSFGGGHGCLC